MKLVTTVASKLPPISDTVDTNGSYLLLRATLSNILPVSYIEFP